MTTISDTLEELALRCEQATGPDRESDVAIYDALFTKAGDFDTAYVAKCYTASLDAAMSLVPEGQDFRVQRFNGGCRAVAWIAARNVGYDGEHPASPALALCAASLRARSAMERSK
jgi:hypothetical protein